MSINNWKLPLIWILVGGFSPALSFAQFTLQDSLIAHYQFNGNALDNSGNGNHGTLFGPIYTADRFGNPSSALFMDGVNDYATLLPNSKFKPQLPVTIAAWVRINDYDSNILFWNDWKVNEYHGVWMNCVNGKISAAFGDGGPIGAMSRRSKGGTTTLALNTWYHIAVVIRGGLDMDIYVNGKNDCGTYGGSGGTMAYSSSPGRLGEIDPLASNNSTHDFLHGSLDDIRFYNRALSSTEILSLQDNVVPNFATLNICVGDAVPLPAPTGYQFYTWNPGTGLSCTSCQSPTASPLQSTSYKVFMTKAPGCVDTFTYHVVVDTCCQPFDILLSSLQPPSCFGGSNGQMQLSAPQGAAPVQYSINGGPFQGSGILSGLPAGSYQITAKDVNACLSDTVFVVPDGSPILHIVDSATICLGDAVPLPLSSGYQSYAWSPGTGLSCTSCQAPTASPLQSTSYVALMIKASGCVDTTTYHVTVDTCCQPFDILLSSLQPTTCLGASNGQLQLSANGGIAPIQYAINGGPFQGSGIFTGLPGGSYQITARDAYLCESDTIFVVPDGPPISLVVDSTKAIPCPGDSLGMIFLSVSGGNAPFLFTLSTGASRTQPLFDSLAAGSYQIFVQDANGCAANDSATISGVDGLFTQISNFTEPLCAGDTNAAITLSTVGGSSPYQYLIDGGPAGGGPIFTGLPAGNFVLETIDNNGCKIAQTFFISSPDSLTVLADMIQAVSCYAGIDGSIAALVDGGTPPYSYQWSNGSNAASATGLSTGVYIIALTDVRGCEAVDSVEVTQPEELIAEALVTDRILCFGDSSGVVTVSIRGGTPPYATIWNQVIPGNVATSLPAGTTIAEVRDDNGCMTTDTVDISQPDPIAILADLTEPLCHDAMNGAIFASALGGTAPFTYSWTNPLSRQGQLLANVRRGSYALTVRDNNGCSKDTLIGLSAPEELKVSLLTLDPSLCGGNNGSLSVEASGGTAPYAYEWTSGASGPLISSLAPGTYLVNVTDSQNCRAFLEIPLTGSYTVTAIAAIDSLGQLPLSEDHPIQFLNFSLGDATYLWSFGDGGQSTRPEPTHLFHEPGDYMVILTAFDADSLCSDSDTLFLTLLEAPRIFVPSAFTPNGDGTNDEFSLSGIQVAELQLRIYSRWGILVNTIQSLDQRWNGKTLSGGDAPEGVYVYHLQAIMITGEEINKSGTITLIR